MTSNKAQLLCKQISYTPFPKEYSRKKKKKKRKCKKNTLRAVIHTVNCNKKQNKFVIDTEWQSRAAKQLKHFGMDL